MACGVKIIKQNKDVITIEAGLVVPSQRETVIIEECTEGFRGTNNILFLKLKGATKVFAFTIICETIYLCFMPFLVYSIFYN